MQTFEYASCKLTIHNISFYNEKSVPNLTTQLIKRSISGHPNHKPRDILEEVMHFCVKKLSNTYYINYKLPIWVTFGRHVQLHKIHDSIRNLGGSLILKLKLNKLNGYFSFIEFIQLKAY